MPSKTELKNAAIAAKCVVPLLGAERKARQQISIREGFSVDATVDAILRA
jgi:hypothetical protein